MTKYSRLSTALRSALPFCAVIALAVGIRIFTSGSLPPLLQPDSESHIRGAVQVMHGTWPTATLLRLPGYALVIAGSIAMFGGSLWSLPVLQHTLGVGNAVLALIIGRQVFGPGVGLAAGILAAVSAPTILYEHFIMTETVAASVMLGCCLLIWRSLLKPTLLLGATCGLLLGFGGVVRPALLSLVPILMIAMTLTHRGRVKQLLRWATPFSIALMCWLTPVLLWNSVTLGTPSLSPMGFHLMFRLVASDTGFTFEAPPHGALASPTQEAVRRILIEQAKPSRPEVRGRRYKEIFTRIQEELGLSEADMYRTLSELGTEAILLNPGYYAVGTLRAISHTAIGEPLQILRESRAISWLGPISHLEVPLPTRADTKPLQDLLALFDASQISAVLLILSGIGVLHGLVSTQQRFILMLTACAWAPIVIGAALAGTELRFRYPSDPIIAIIAMCGAREIARRLLQLPALHFGTLFALRRRP